MPQRCNAHGSQLIIFSYNVSDKNSTEQKMALFKKAHPSNYILKSLRNTILCESPFSLLFFRRQKSNAIRDSEPFYLPFINEIAVFSCHLKKRLSKSGISPLHHENQYLWFVASKTECIPCEMCMLTFLRTLQMSGYESVELSLKLVLLWKSIETCKSITFNSEFWFFPRLSDQNLITTTIDQFFLIWCLRDY